MAKLPKHLIKKFGISKRAWAEFRKSKKKSSSTKRGVSHMAKKTKSTTRRSRNDRMKQATKIATGAAVVALYEVFVSPMIPLKRNLKNILELIIGIVLLTRRNAIMKSAGVALIAINTFEIVVPLIKNFKLGRAAPAVNNSGVDALLQS